MDMECKSVNQILISYSANIIFSPPQIKIWFQNHRYKTKKAIQEKGFESQFGNSLSPRRLCLPLTSVGGLAYSPALAGGGKAGADAALLAAHSFASLHPPPAHFSPFGPLPFPPPPPHHHSPFSPLLPTHSSASALPPPSSLPSTLLPNHHALLSAFSQNLKQAPKLW